MLTLLLLHPDSEYTLSELAAELSLALSTVQREADRLVGSGLIRERRVGRARLVAADPESRYTRPLTELVSLAFGPQFVVGEEFGDLGAVAVGIYGSWAARHAGATGPAPNDVDVMVIGDVPRRDMYEAAERAEQRLGLPVNPVLRSHERWAANADPLIQQIRTSPVVWVAGQEPQEGVDALSWPTTRRGKPASPSWPSRVCARPQPAAITLSKKSSGLSSARH